MVLHTITRPTPTMHANQDAALLVVALIRYSHQFREADPGQADRAAELAEAIAQRFEVTIEDTRRM